MTFTQIAIYLYRCSNEALPRPISKRKDKEHKKKKSKVVSTVNAEAEIGLKTANAPPEVASYNTAVPANIIHDQKPG